MAYASGYRRNLQRRIIEEAEFWQGEVDHQDYIREQTYNVIRERVDLRAFINGTLPLDLLQSDMTHFIGMPKMSAIRRLREISPPFGSETSREQREREREEDRTVHTRRTREESEREDRAEIQRLNRNDVRFQTFLGRYQNGEIDSSELGTWIRDTERRINFIEHSRQYGEWDREFIQESRRLHDQLSIIEHARRESDQRMREARDRAFAQQQLELREQRFREFNAQRARLEQNPFMVHHHGAVSDEDVRPVTHTTVQEDSTNCTEHVYQDNECPICLNDFSSLTLVVCDPCGHVYCDNCIKRITICAMCRKHIVRVLKRGCE
jgi:hypothetical protein